MSDFCYYVDHTNDIIAVHKVAVGHKPPELAVNTKRSGIAQVVDVDALSPALQLRLYNHLHETNHENLDGFEADTVCNDILAKLSRLEVTTTDPVETVGEPDKPQRASRKSRAKAKIISDQADLSSETETATSSTSGDGAAPVEEGPVATNTKTTKTNTNPATKTNTNPATKKAAKKAAKKKAAKKAATKTKAPKAPKAPKVDNGLPREGSKKEKLLKVIRKPGGATMAEMLKVTGWKACLGTAKEVAVKAGLTFETHRDPEGKKATRWEAKGKVKGE